MKYAPRELCEKLQKMGCKSENWPSHTYMLFKPTKNETADERWRDSDDFCNSEISPTDSMRLSGYRLYKELPKFSQNDFTGCHEQAMKNAKLIFPVSYVCSKCGLPFDQKVTDDLPCLPTGNHSFATSERFYARHAMIDSDDWVKFLEESLK